MMATGPSGDSLLADVSIPSQTQLVGFGVTSMRTKYDMQLSRYEPVINCTPQIDQSHEDHKDEPIANGHSILTGEDTATRRPLNSEDQVYSAEASLSGGSDTEVSRAGRPRDVDPSHGRSNSSAKKPATFKAVSVNKTFLASKTAPGGGLSKPVDRPTQGSSTPPAGSSSLSASRPRLVAKTGTSARDSSPRLTAASKGAKVAIAPDPSAVWNKNRPPEPKKFTDEELKKYGIHMASRLNEDDTQGQNKWADIDDDDEDWAPEAITWGDGTKTTLPQLEDQPGFPQQGNTPPSSAMPRSSAASLMVKPPAARLSGLATGRGMILKSASQEKPALVTKAPAPVAPAKSPWATLPPIDRASPGTVETATPTYDQSRASPMTKALNHNQPREIAADDFSRSSWRESTSLGNRELFNSQSGHYDPVPGRRSSLKTDPYNRPALLQRAAPADQVGGAHSVPPARAPQDGALSRRRGSSSVSGGSASIHQRPVKVNDPTTPPTDVGTTSKPNIATPADASLSADNPTHVAPSKRATESNQPPAVNEPSPEPRRLPETAGEATEPGAVSLHGQADQIVDQVDYQKKLMRERIDLARKRRQEEEAREEAARKERIQKKLEALGPPPERKSEKKEVSPRTKQSKPTQIQQREKATVNDQDRELVEGTSASTGKLPDSAAATQTDGSQADPKTQPAAAPSRPPATSTAPRRLSQGQESRRSDLWGGPGARSDRLSSWGSGAPPSSRNVWGSPDNDRGLGNGTFNPDLGRIGNTSNSTVQSSKGPSPIAPPSNSTRTPSQTMPPNTHVASAKSQNIYSPAGSDLAKKWVTAVAEKDRDIGAARLKDRISRERQLMETGLTMEDSQPVIKDSWRPVHVPGDGSRYTVGSVDVQSHHPAPWKPKDGSPKAPAEDQSLTASAGIIGSGAPTQSRPSRFFPAKDARDSVTRANLSRPLSPTPPPPTMEGHPVYEGDVLRPHVSLPRPQPVVRLPPPAQAHNPNKTQTSNIWAARLGKKEHSRDDAGHSVVTPESGNWQAKFHRLLHGDRQSHSRDFGIDAFSRGPLDTVGHEVSATVLLPSVISTQSSSLSRGFTTKPMAEECFEEQEMGSLPQVRLPHRAPEAAWQPAVAQARIFPKRFLVQAAVMEPFQIISENDAERAVISVSFPGMKAARVVSLPHARNRGGSKAPPAPRVVSRRSLGNAARGAKKEPSATHRNESVSFRGARGARGGGGNRSRHSDNWTPRSLSQTQTANKPT